MTDSTFLPEPLRLPPVITVTALLGESKDRAFEQLTRVVAVIQARYLAIAASDQREWDGDKSTLVIVPSSTVLADWRTGALLELIVRTCRKAGVSVCLVDAAREFHSEREDRNIYPVAHFGTPAVREFALDPEINHVTFDALTAAELVELTERADPITLTTPGTLTPVGD